MNEFLGMWSGAGAIAGAGNALSRTLEFLKPGLQRKFKENIVHSGLLPYEVPANHHLTRVFRLSWCRACTGILDRASDAVRHGAPAGCDTEIFVAFVGNVRKAVTTISRDATALDQSTRLSTLNIDDNIKPILLMLCDHLLRESRLVERQEIEYSFVRWLAEVSGFASSELPPIVLNALRDRAPSDEAGNRGFPYLLLDQIAYYYQNSSDYVEASKSIELAVNRLQYQALNRTLDRLMDVVDADDDRSQIILARRENQSELAEIRAILAETQEIDDKLTTIITDIGTIKIELEAKFGSAASSPLELKPDVPSVIVATNGEHELWWSDVARMLASSSERLSGPDALAVVHWQLDEVNSRALKQPTSWQRLLNGNNVKHSASVVLITNSLGAETEADAQFEEKLAKKGLLVTPENPNGVFFQTSYSALERIALKKQGAVPITVETRLILETYFADRAVCIFDASDPIHRDGWVKNLLSLLQHLGIPGQIAGKDTDDVFWATSLVRKALSIPADAVANPYLRLEHFAPSDADHYFGRENAVTQFKAAFLASGKTILRIEGPSGVGKSSFMNVRIAEVAREHSFDYFTFRPTDLMLAVDGSQRPLVALCDELARAFGWEPPTMSHPNVVSPDYALAKRAAEAWIAGNLVGDRRILIAIDQFEEIVDNIANDWNGGSWRALVELIGSLAGPSLAVVFTLETSRRPLFEQLCATGAYADAIVIKLDDDNDFLRDVIEKPFADAGYQLDEKTVETLLKEARQYGLDAGETISSLPLLALKLYSLFDYVVRNFSVRGGRLSLGLQSIEHDKITMPLDIGSEVENLALAAWNEAPGDDHDFNVFLRPFIRVVATPENDEGRMVLATVPARAFYSVADRQYAFERRRLIVPAPGGFRLAHEAIVRRWSMARHWYERERATIAAETAFLERAYSWERKARPKIENTLESDIAIAASILRSRTSDWAMVDNAKLDDQNVIERDFCLAHFNLTDDPNVTIENSPYKSQYIHVAASYGLLDLVARYLEKDPAAVNLSQLDGRDPLMVSAFVSAPMVRFLLDKGANANAVSAQGWSALDSAIWGGADDAFAMLVEVTSPDPREVPSVNALYSAARRNRMDLIHRLEAAGWRHDRATFANATPLIGAAVSGDMAIFRHCLEHGDPTYRPTGEVNAFDVAAQNGHVKLLSLVIGHSRGAECLRGASPAGWTSLMYAASQLQPEAIRLLVNAGVDANARLADDAENAGRTALHWALDWLFRFDGRASRFVADKTADALAELLKAEMIDVNLADKAGRTAWQMAHHHPEIQALIEAHPSFDLRKLPEEVQNPLDRAVEARDAEKIKLILSNETYKPLAGRVRDGSMPAEKMCSLGLTELVAELIVDGHVAPWSANGGNLFDDAWRAGDEGLIRLVIERMPAKLSAPELNVVLLTVVVARAKSATAQRVPGDALVDDAISRAADSGVLETVLVRIGQLGSLDLFQRLVRAGADPNIVDDWGRTIWQKSSDAVLASGGSAASKWLPPQSAAAPTISDDDRSVFSAGDIEAITALIENWDDRQRCDRWGRTAADLVPDAIGGLVRGMIQKEKDQN